MAIFVPWYMEIASEKYILQSPVIALQHIKNLAGQ